MTEKTRIEKSEPLDFMGVAVYGNPETSALAGAWNLFGDVADDAGLSRIGKDIFGLQIYHPKFPEQFELTYMACMKLESGMEVPIRMLSKSLNASSYAVQKVDGGVAGIDDALIYLYREYIPGNGLRAAMPIDFERYCNVQSHESCPDEIEIWVPVESV